MGLLSASKSGKWILHNEDAWPESKYLAYLLTATIEEDGHIVEQFTSYCYPGTLPGGSFAFNQHGLTFAINAMACGKQFFLDTNIPL